MLGWLVAALQPNAAPTHCREAAGRRRQPRSAKLQQCSLKDFYVISFTVLLHRGGGGGADFIHLQPLFPATVTGQGDQGRGRGGGTGRGREKVPIKAKEGTNVF